MQQCAVSKFQSSGSHHHFSTTVCHCTQYTVVASARPTGALYVAIAMPLEIHAVRAMRIRSIFNFICKVFQNVRTQQYTYILTGLQECAKIRGGRGAGGEYCVLKWIFAPSAKIKIMFEVISIKFWYTANVYRGFRGVHRFSLQCLWKRIARITEKPYTHETERLCVLWGNPEIFTDCGELRQLSQGFPHNL